MPTNVFFNHAVNTEQHLYEDLVVESLRFYGHETYYLPREIVEEDTILGEDVQSKFGDAYSVEMYLDNVEGFEGEDLFSKFGIQTQEECTFTLALRTWERFISLDSNLVTSLRPNEGDLVYFPMSGSMFEIRYVEDQNPFFQIGKLFIFKLKCTLFEYSGEDFDTNIDAIDIVEDQQAYTIQLTLDSSGSGDYAANESITIGGTTIGEVTSWKASTRLLTIKDVTTTIQVGDTITGAVNGAVYTVSSIRDILTMNDGTGADNADIETKADNYLDFSETNPFGEVT
jgi:hypothetical protein